LTYHEAYLHPLVTTGKSGLVQQNTFLPRAHLFVLPSLVKPPPHDDANPPIFTSPGLHCAVQSDFAPPPLSLPRHLQLDGAALFGQQIGLPQCYIIHVRLRIHRSAILWSLTQLFFPHPASSQPTTVKPDPQALAIAFLSSRLTHLPV
jgi:hypothetical protein